MDASGSEFIYSFGYLNFNIWDFGDKNYTIKEKELLEAVPNLYDLIEKAYNNWENKMKTVFLSELKLNPDTNRYDHDGDMHEEKLHYFVAKNGDGFKINFGEITGDFGCSCLELKSLKGAPQVVRGDFDCYGNRLTSLKGSPHTVGGSFECSYNNLTSLKGAPHTVGGDFVCYQNRLTSLEGSPQKVIGNFKCSYNPNLHSLEGIGKVEGKIYKDF